MRKVPSLNHWQVIRLTFILAGLVSGCGVREDFNQTAQPASPDVKKWREQSLESAPRAEPPPPPEWKAYRYTMEFRNLDLHKVLKQLANDTNLKVFVDTRIQARLNLNLQEQNLDDILPIVQQQCQCYVSIENQTLFALPNDHILQTYAIGYPNLQRQTHSLIKTSLQLSANVQAGASTNPSSNQSSSEISNTSQNHFWPSLLKTIGHILKSLTKDKAKVDEHIVANPESGRVSIYTDRITHQKLRSELSAIIDSMNRQVLIEATVVEIELSQEKKNGLDWQALLDNGLRLAQAPIPNDGAPTFTLEYKNPSQVAGGLISAFLQFLESFGSVKVISQPKLIALNNQSAVMKVVDERVYFTTRVENNFTEKISNTNFETTIHSIPVGFTLAITPWIGQNGFVTLNLKPSLTRVVRMIDDPNPALAEAGVRSQVPELQIRELETVMRIFSGQIGIIGGLIQESRNQNDSGIPALHKARGLGWLFGTSQNRTQRSELLILLRPLVYPQ